MTVHSWYENYLKVSLTPENVTFQVKHLESHILQKKQLQPDDCFHGAETAPVDANISDRPVSRNKKSHPEQVGLKIF